MSCCAVLCFAVLCCALHCCIVLCCCVLAAMLCQIDPCCALLCNSVLHMRSISFQHKGFLTVSNIFGARSTSCQHLACGCPRIAYVLKLLWYKPLKWRHFVTNYKLLYTPPEPNVEKEIKACCSFPLNSMLSR